MLLELDVPTWTNAGGVIVLPALIAVFVIAVLTGRREKR